jgi:predicted nucleic acid-binding protein
VATLPTPELSGGAGFLIDSNVIIDIITRDPIWYVWSVFALGTAARSSAIYINPLIYAEISTQFDDLADLDATLTTGIVRRASLPYSAAFLAAKAFEAYRRNGGDRRSPLPDFYIGAHAVVQGMTLVTRDVARYKTYFPTLKLMSPE